MEEFPYRVRIAVLWLLSMVGFLAYRTIAISEGATEVSVLSNQELANVLLIMMVFAFLSLLLKDRTNRLMNIVAGAIFFVVFIAMFAEGITGYPSAPFNLMTGATVVFLTTIVWFAYRWPKAARVPADK